MIDRQTPVNTFGERQFTKIAALFQQATNVQLGRSAASIKFLNQFRRPFSFGNLHVGDTYLIKTIVSDGSINFQKLAAKREVKESIRLLV